MNLYYCRSKSRDISRRRDPHFCSGMHAPQISHRSRWQTVAKVYLHGWLNRRRHFIHRRDKLDGWPRDDILQPSGFLFFFTFFYGHRFVYPQSRRPEERKRNKFFYFIFKICFWFVDREKLLNIFQLYSPQYSARRTTNLTFSVRHLS